MPEQFYPVTEDFSWVEQFCNQPIPITMTRVLRHWLILHFSSPDRIENRTPGRYLTSLVWRPDHTTDIVIEPVYKWTPQLTEKRPAILIARGEWQRIQLGLDDRYQDFQVENQSILYECWWKGVHILYCIANDGNEAELLSAEVTRELNQFAPIVRHLLALRRLAVQGVGKLSKLEEARENWVVPIALEYIFSEAWQLQPIDASSGQSLWPFKYFFEIQ